MENTEQQQMNLKQKDRLALVISIIFVALIGIFAYRYFNNLDIDFPQLANFDTTQENAQNGDNEVGGEVSSANTARGEDRDMRTEEDSTDQAQNNQPTQMLNDTVAATDTSVFGTWTAKNYNHGDLNAGTDHTVVTGDTLWELAEAAYGDGSMWTHILSANSQDVGFLANGSQVLIVPGQVLHIPTV